MALPTNVNFGTVVGQFLLAYADGSDPDQHPDGIPAKGSIFFRPSPLKLLDGLSTPNPVTILPAVVECVLDASGYLLGGDATRGVRLVATDDPDLNPLDWTWTVEFRLTDQDDIPVPLPSFSIGLPLDTIVDLTTVSPVPSANGLFYLVGPTGLTGPTGATGPQGEAATVAAGTTATGASGSSASVANSGTSGDAVFDFTIPRGDTGIQGIQGEQGVQGPIGETGATGIEWQGEWDAATDYVNNDAVFYNGASWFASGDPIIGEIPETASEHWYPLAIQGAQGTQGIKGDQGDQGIQGETGLTGETGPTGSTGDAATIAVGTVTTGNAGSSVLISNAGTSGAAVFDFTIPKGDTGNLGALAATSPIVYSSGSSTISLDQDALVIDGGTA
jgi:hypothetical protein